MVAIRNWTVGLGVAVFAVGCGPSVEEPITRLATCGTEGPVQLLQTGTMGPRYASSLGDRLLLTVASPEETDADDRAATLETWSVGTCGESPVRLTVGLTVYPVGDLLVACDWDDQMLHADILRIDPMGQAEPVVLFEAVDCGIVETNNGWLAVNHDKQELWHRPEPSRDDSPTRLLATGFVDTEGACDPFRVYCDPTPQGSGSTVAVMTPDGEVVRYDLADGSSSVVATEAAWGWATPDASALWWREARPNEDEDMAPVHQQDLRTGADVVVYDGTAPHQREWPYGLVRLRGAQSDSLLDLRDGALHVLPFSARSIGTRPNGPVLLWGDDLEQSYAWSEDEGKAVELPRVPWGCPREWGALGLDTMHGEDCERRRGDLWSHPYDGGAPRVVAEDVAGSNFLNLGDRVVWSQQERVTDDGSYTHSPGDLFVTDDEVGRLHLDEHAHLLAWPLKELGGDVVYAVEDGDRSGVWRTATR